MICCVLSSCSLRKARRLLSRSQLRRACRQPCEQISLRRVPQGPAQVPVLAPPHPSLRMRGPIVIHDWPSPALFPQPVLSLSHLLPVTLHHTGHKPLKHFLFLFSLLLLKLSLPIQDKRLTVIKHLANNPNKMILVYSEPSWAAAWSSCFNIFLSTECSLSFNANTFTLQQLVTLALSTCLMRIYGCGN